MFIGLTGGMGCGKSAALNFFSELEYITLDADTICHTLYNNNKSEFFRKIYEKWGDKILSGSRIDRQAVAQLVFEDKREREWLNSLLHPALLREALKSYEDSGKVDTIFDVPLLYEVGWEKYFDKIVAVWCSEKIQLQRLLKRGMTEEEIEKRNKTQLAPDLKMERADYAIINNGNLAQLKEQCQIIVNRLRKLK